MRRTPVLLTALVCLAVPHGSARAAWPIAPFGNVPICVAPGYQHSSQVISDGAGGVIIAWDDYRSGTWDIYVQHVLESGVVDPAWPVNGRAVFVVPANQVDCRLVSDGAGGAIIIWTDYRSLTNFDVYAHHVLATGIVDPAWPVDGRALCTAPGDQTELQVTTDGAGGAIVSWSDARAGSGDVYAQRVLATGVTAPGWPIDGRACCLAAGYQLINGIVPDGAGGALLAWIDQRNPSAAVYAGHLLASGLVDPAWPVDGRMFSTGPGSSRPYLVPSGADAAIVTWGETRGGVPAIYAQRVLFAGTTDPSWPANGRALSTVYDGYPDMAAASDGEGGAFVAWSAKGTSPALDLYAQHILASGSVDVAWPANGLPVSKADDKQLQPAIARDGVGGAFVVWVDFRPGTSNDGFVHHLLATGDRDPRWSTNGEWLDLGAYQPSRYHLIEAGTGAVIAVWEDWRNLADGDIFATRVTIPDGVVATLASLVSAEWNGAAAELVWSGDALAGTQVAVYREENRAGWTQIATVTGDGEGYARFTDPSVVAGREYGYRIGMPLDGAEVLVGETRIAIPAGRLAIQAVSPNPARGARLGLRATFAGTGPARARVLDLSGRVVLEREVPTGSGGAELDLGGAALRPGVYVLELVQGGERATARFTYLK